MDTGQSVTSAVVHSQIATTSDNLPINNFPTSTVSANSGEMYRHPTDNLPANNFPTSTVSANPGERYRLV